MGQEKRVVQFSPRPKDKRGGIANPEQSRDGLPSVFARLGPKVSETSTDIQPYGSLCMASFVVPYVPEPVQEPPLAGMIFGCTSETYHECINRQLFGLPMSSNKAQVLRIAPGAKLFLFNFHLKVMHGIFKAISHGGIHIVREAFGGGFGAQVKVQLVEECPSLPETIFKEAIRENYIDARKFKYCLSKTQVHNLTQLFRKRAAQASVPQLDTKYNGRIVHYHPPEQVQHRFTQQEYACHEDLKVGWIDTSQISGSSHPERSPKNNPRPQLPSSDMVRQESILMMSATPLASRTPPHIRNQSRHCMELALHFCPRLSSEGKKRKKHSQRTSRSLMRDLVISADVEQHTVPPLRTLKSMIIRPTDQDHEKQLVNSSTNRGSSREYKRDVDQNPHERKRNRIEKPAQEQKSVEKSRSTADVHDAPSPSQDRPQKMQRRELVRTTSVSHAVAGINAKGKTITGDASLDGQSKREVGPAPPPHAEVNTTKTLVLPKSESSKDLVEVGYVVNKRVTEEMRKEAKIEVAEGQEKGGEISFDVGDIVDRKVRSASAGLVDNNVEGSVSRSSSVLERTKRREVVEGCTTVQCQCIADKDLSTVASNGDCEQIKMVLKDVSSDGTSKGSINQDQRKDGLEIFISLTVESAKSKTQSSPPATLESHRVLDDVDGMIQRLGDEHGIKVLSPTNEQVLQLGCTSDIKKEEPNECVMESPDTSGVSAEAGICIREGEQRMLASSVPCTETQLLDGQLSIEATATCLGRLCGEEDRRSSANTRPILSHSVQNVAASVSKSADGGPLVNKKNRAEDGFGGSTSFQELKKLAPDKFNIKDTDCTYLFREGSAGPPGKDIKEHHLDNYSKENIEIPQISARSSSTESSENRWEGRTLPYARLSQSHKSRIFDSSGSAMPQKQPVKEIGIIDVVSIPTGREEGSILSAGKGYVTSGCIYAVEKLSARPACEKQLGELVCELGIPSGLSSEDKRIGGQILGEDVAFRDEHTDAAAPIDKATISKGVDSPVSRYKPQNMNTGLDFNPAEGLVNVVTGQAVQILPNLPREGLEVDQKLCKKEGLSQGEDIQPGGTMYGISEVQTKVVKPDGQQEKECRTCLGSSTSRHQDEPVHSDGASPMLAPILLTAEATVPCVGENCNFCAASTEEGLVAPMVMSSRCDPGVEEAKGKELEVNLTIEEEELEICLPTDEDEEFEFDTGSGSHVGQLWGVSNRDITPWKLFQ